MISPAATIRKLLIDLGLGTASGSWKIFVGFLPDQPDDAICVYDTTGKLDGRVMAGEQIEHEGVQIRVRNRSYPDTWDKINTIATTLDTIKRTIVEISGSELYLIHNVSKTGSIMSLGIEERGSRRYHHFTLNVVLTMSPHTV